MTATSLAMSGGRLTLRWRQGKCPVARIVRIGLATSLRIAPGRKLQLPARCASGDDATSRVARGQPFGAQPSPLGHQVPIPQPLPAHAAGHLVHGVALPYLCVDAISAMPISSLRRGTEFWGRANPHGLPGPMGPMQKRLAVIWRFGRKHKSLYRTTLDTLVGGGDFHAPLSFPIYPRDAQHEDLMRIGGDLYKAVGKVHEETSGRSGRKAA